MLSAYIKLSWQESKGNWYSKKEIGWVLEAFADVLSLLGMLRLKFSAAKSRYRAKARFFQVEIWNKRLESVKLLHACILIFGRLDEKYKLLANFEKILKFFDKNSIENWFFLFFIENFLIKLELSEITPFFYNNFFVFGGISLFPPWRRPCVASSFHSGNHNSTSYH